MKVLKVQSLFAVYLLSIHGLRTVRMWGSISGGNAKKGEIHESEGKKTYT